MSRQPKIPDELRLGPFTRETALKKGLTVDQLRSPCWTRVIRDVYCLRSITMTNEVRLAALKLAVPAGSVVTGRTAAWLHGVWTPPPGHRIPLECAPGPNGRRFSREGVKVGRVAIPWEDIVGHGTLRFTSPVRTCIGLMLRSDLVGAVVWADLFRHKLGLTDEDLKAYAANKARWPNVRTVRLAIDLSHSGAESPMETRLRMVLVLAGCPEPYVNRPFLDENDNVVARPDLCYLDPDLGLEYDGAYHFEGHQPERDDVRENKLLVRGMPVLRYGSRALKTPERIVADVVAIRPDFLPLRPLDISGLLVTGYHRPAS